MDGKLHIEWIDLEKILTALKQDNKNDNSARNYTHTHTHSKA